MPFVNSVRAKTVLCALVPTAIMLVAVALIAIYAYERATRDVVQQRDTELARVSAARLSEALNRHALVLQGVAADADVQSMELNRVRSALDRTRRLLLVFDAGVTVYNGGGRAVWSRTGSGDLLGAEIPASEFDRVRDTRRPVFSDVFTDAVSGEQVVLVGVPIIGRGTEFKGVMTGLSTIRYSLIGATYAQVLEFKTGRTGFAYLVDGAGRLIYHRDSNRVGTVLTDIAPVSRATKGETGAIVTKDPAGKRVISGFAPVPGTGWAVVTQERWDNVVGPIRAYNWLLIGLLVTGGVLSAALIFFVGGRILKPIKDLTIGARRIAGGDFEHTIDAKTGDEVEALAAQFNTMAGALKASYADLERNVAERTTELQETNQTLRALIQTSPVPIIAVDRDEKVRIWNPASERVFGWSEQEVLDGPLPTIPGDYQDEFHASLTQTMNGQPLDGYETRRRRKDGGSIDVGVWTAPLRDAEGATSGVMAVIADLTERKKAESTLQEMAVLEERNRVAREMHDTLAQGFTGIVLQLEAAEQVMDERSPEAPPHITRAKNLARESLEDARRSVWNLLPRALEQQPVSDALQEEVNQFNSAQDGNAGYGVSGEKRELAPDIETALLRICQESLLNIRKHARATEVEVNLAFRPDSVCLQVQDNGVGFEVGGTARPGAQGGFGLTSMEQRALLLRGSLSVTSKMHQGTRIEVKLPTTQTV